jgi:hypothetical protein
LYDKLLCKLLSLLIQISKYSFSFSIHIHFLLFNSAIFQVVKLQANGSNTVSHSLLHDNIWSSASFSGNTAGCKLLLLVINLHILYLIQYSVFIFLSLSFLLQSFCVTVFFPQLHILPASIFFLSTIGLNVLGFHLLNTYINSNI